MPHNDDRLAVQDGGRSDPGCRKTPISFKNRNLSLCHWLLEKKNLKLEFFSKLDKISTRFAEYLRLSPKPGHPHPAGPPWAAGFPA